MKTTKDVQALINARTKDILDREINAWLIQIQGGNHSYPFIKSLGEMKIKGNIPEYDEDDNPTGKSTEKEFTLKQFFSQNGVAFDMIMADHLSRRIERASVEFIEQVEGIRGQLNDLLSVHEE